MLTTTGISIQKVPTTDVEPVELDMLKRLLKIDFPDHDQELADALMSAREEVERYCNLSIIPSEVTVKWETLTGDWLPYGPVKEIDTDISDYTKKGQADFPFIQADSYEPVEITYTAGFVNVPYGLKLAISQLAANHFLGEAKYDWMSIAKKYMNKSWI